MKPEYLKAVLKTSLLTTLFGIGAFSANGAGHLPSTYQVEGKNHGRVIDSIITEIAPGLMRIENENAVVFTFSETREDFPKALSGTCRSVAFMKASDPIPYSTTGFCYAVDGDGDQYSFTYHGDGPGGTWETANGTGKYEGLGGSGTYAGEAGLPDGFIASFTGQNSFK